MIIFGGRKTATYLNDLHILDLGNDPEHMGIIIILHDKKRWKYSLCVCCVHIIPVSNTKSFLSCGKGFMEYTAVKYENMPPLARG